MFSSLIPRLSLFEVNTPVGSHIMTHATSVPALSNLAAELAVVEKEGEEEGDRFSCMVCREGIKLKPQELLGVCG